MTSHVRPPGAFTCARHLAVTVTLRLEGRARTLSGPSRTLSPARTLAPAAAARSASPAPGNKAQQVQGQLPFAISELDQRPVTADVAIGAGAAGNRQLLRGR